MKNIRKSLWIAGIAAGVGLLLAGTPVEARRGADNIVVILRGDGTPVPTPAGVAANNGCFRTKLYNATTNNGIGTGVDCLDIVDLGAGGLSINRTTIFNMAGGELVATGLTSVVPIFGDASPLYTHIVGDVDDDTQNVNPDLSNGTFLGATGNVRLSGAVNLSGDDAPIVFNCVFVIDLD